MEPTTTRIPIELTIAANAFDVMAAMVQQIPPAIKVIDRVLDDVSDGHVEGLIKRTVPLDRGFKNVRLLLRGQLGFTFVISDGLSEGGEPARVLLANVGVYLVREGDDEDD